MKKRAVSAVIVSVLIILLAVVAVSLVWTLVIPEVKQATHIGTYKANVQVVTSNGYTTYDPSSETSTVQFENTGGEDSGELIKLKAIFSSGGNSYTYTTSDAPNVNEMETFCFDLSGLPERPTSVSVAPVFLINGQEVTGNIVSTEDIQDGDLSGYSCTNGIIYQWEKVYAPTLDGTIEGCYIGIEINENKTKDGYGITCYQESANSTSSGDGSCALNYSGEYVVLERDQCVANIFDGNWDTSCNANSDTSFSLTQFKVVYKKPKDSISGMWKIKSSAGEMNLTIPAECWDTPDGNIYLSIISPGRTISFPDGLTGDPVVGGYGNTTWSCYSKNFSNDKIELYHYQNRNADVYEEGMEWVLGYNAPKIEFKLLNQSNLYGYYNSSVKYYNREMPADYEMITYDSSGEMISKYSVYSGRFQFYDEVNETTNETSGGINVLNYSILNEIIPYDDRIDSIKISYNGSLTDLDVNPEDFECIRKCKIENETLGEDDSCCTGFVAGRNGSELVCIDPTDGVCSEFEDAESCYGDCYNDTRCLYEGCSNFTCMGDDYVRNVTSCACELKPECNLTDLNADGTVNNSDLYIFSSAMNNLESCKSNPTYGDSCCYADINNDGAIDASDYIIFKGNFGATGPKPCRQELRTC